MELMKKLISILLLLACFKASAQLNTVTVTITNTPAITSTLTLNGNTFNWTNATPIPPLAVFIGADLPTDGTNLYNVVVAYLPQFGISVQQVNKTNLVFQGIGLTGSVFSTVPGAAWATITTVSGGAGDQTNVVVPISSVDSSIRPSVETQLASDIDQYSTYAFVTNSPAMGNFVSTNTLQAVWGKTLIGATINGGQATNLSNLVVNVTSATAGTMVLQGSYPLNNQTNYVVYLTDNLGNVILSLNCGGELFAPIFSVPSILSANSILVSNNLSASDIFSTNGFQSFGFISEGQGDKTQTEVSIYGTNGWTGDILDVFHDYQTTLDFNVNSNGVSWARTMTANTFSNLNTSGTNKLGGLIIYPRTNNASLANGINIATFTGTNYLVNISGPSAAFSTAGFTGGIDDRFVLLEYDGGLQWTINNNGVDPTAANRVLCPNGVDLVIPASGGPVFVLLKYLGSSSRWEVVSSGASTSSGSFSGSFTGNGNALTNVGTVIQTNWVSGQVYVNPYPSAIRVSGSATLVVAAIVGNAVMSLEGSGVAGSDTNQFGISTLITSIAMNCTNYLAIDVPAGGSFTWTNRSTGSGNSASVVRGQLRID